MRTDATVGSSGRRPHSALINGIASGCRKSRAYRGTRPAELEELYSSPWLPDNPPQHTDTMGRRTQKTQVGPSKDSQDIGEMLQRPMPSKMAALPNQHTHNRWR
ncbi:Hypothetical predicted protein [Pelobates cultripes]|uniref:Uncharacterized protein n=1 Tax=Pelobates cultripes TaxID=61616 RepID=A0AAD1SXG7_PELCU|nr:Hypothetical predicted protein [Pelobates cultripes]